MVFRPLVGAAGQAALIASLGLALVIQEGLRLLQGADDLWLGPLGGATWTVLDAGGFTVVASASQAVVVGGVILLLALQFGVVDRGRFGRQWRAVAADRPMAALVGVDVGRISGLVMALATLYAALAGAIVVLHYGGASFHMGTMLGFKALTAAILGGLGSPVGAVLGALTVAGVETFWTGYVDTQSKDIAVFALLAIALMARPQGLGLARLRGPGVD
jgi:branched-chain amino acid transport system permease protein